MYKNYEIEILEIKFWEEPVVDEPVDEPVIDPVEEKLYAEADMDKAVARRQAALKRARNAEDKSKDLEDKLAAMPDPDDYAKLKDSHTELVEKFKEMKELREDAELKNVEDDKERARIKMQREFDKEKDRMDIESKKLQQQLDDYSSERERYKKDMESYRERALEGAIAATASMKAFNPTQIVRLTMDDFVYDEKEDKWVREVYDKGGKLIDLLGVDEHINSFLDDPINENLLKVRVKSGSETPRGNRAAATDDDLPVDQTPDDAMYTWASEAGFSINKKSSAEDKVWLFKTYTRLHGLDKKKE